MLQRQPRKNVQIHQQTCYVCRAELSRVAIGKTVFPRCASCMGKKRPSFDYCLLATVDQRCIAQMNLYCLKNIIRQGVTGRKNHCLSLL